jgi:hypothetical protein
LGFFGLRPQTCPEVAEGMTIFPRRTNYPIKRFGNTPSFMMESFTAFHCPLLTFHFSLFTFHCSLFTIRLHKGETMTQITKFHRIILWLAVIDFSIFGLGFFFAPVGFNELLGVPAPDPIAIRSLGGFLLGAAVAALLAARSGNWAEIRIANLSLIAWNGINCLGMLYDLTVNGGPAGLWPNVFITAFFAITLAIAHWRGPVKSEE